MTKVEITSTLDHHALSAISRGCFDNQYDFRTCTSAPWGNQQGIIDSLPYERDPVSPGDHPLEPKYLLISLTMS
jgi:hypothetical protein